MSSPLVIFDLDGTLVDTAPDLIDSLNHTIAQAGLEPVTYDDVTFLVGQGARVMIRRAFQLRKVELDDAQAETLFEAFVQHYGVHMPGKSQPFDGVVACLERLSAAGMRLAVCTNKHEELAVSLIEKLGLTPHFVVITGGDTFPVRKPDAAHIFGTIEKAGGTRDNAVMVGDSVNDILAAKNAGVPSIAVDFGYSDVPIADLSPSTVISHFDALTVDLVKDLLATAEVAS